MTNLTDSPLISPDPVIGASVRWRPSSGCLDSRARAEATGVLGAAIGSVAGLVFDPVFRLDIFDLLAMWETLLPVERRRLVKGRGTSPPPMRLILA